MVTAMGIRVKQVLFPLPIPWMAWFMVKSHHEKRGCPIELETKLGENKYLKLLSGRSRVSNSFKVHL
jgi:hypothetical protein